MNKSIVVEFDPLRSLAFGAVGASYSLVGSLFTHPVRLLVMQNYLNAAVTVSFDGVTDHMQLENGAQIVLDFTSNASSIGGVWNLPVGKGVYVKQSGAPTSGAFYASAAYGKGE